MKLFIYLFSKLGFDLFICLIVYIYHFYIFFKWLINLFICSLFVLIKTLFYLFILLFGCLLFIFVSILLFGYCLFIVIYNLFRTLFKQTDYIFSMLQRVFYWHQCVVIFPVFVTVLCMEQYKQRSWNIFFYS